jgi:DNA-binding response OmpR family regulator
MSKTVLCVDDEANLLKLYEQELAAEGYEVVLASNGQEALQSLDKNDPDILVLDICLTDCDGLNLLDEIRRTRRDLPIILNSAYSSYKHDFQSWLADDYIVKSSDLRSLKLKIRELLHL